MLTSFDASHDGPLGHHAVQDYFGSAVSMWLLSILHMFLKSCQYSAIHEGK
jgi:hypothetical protein